MAHTALDDEEIKEYFDTPDELDQKIKTLADFIRNAKYFIAYTGAGISTAAGINDFRGPTGVWTARAKGVAPPPRTVLNPEPTLTHMAFVELMKNDYLKFLVSQNCDGLHLKSGIPTNKIAELHGNSNCEACAKCGKVYYRQTRVKSLDDLQKTPYDDQCALRIFARCDDVMRMMMEELNLVIPSYIDLQLWSDAQWLTDFEQNWPFRTAGDTDWFSGDI
ncbi:unnamed protein product [Rotaria sordida]|uniref:protein acetyllysine N-acetyltransferase n=1 Tax=Rotaria sordida TaxID=392033 RepID=A0A819JR23_9BILA|nr:unnamed protein product [Rotaria sordida]CAF3933848.1 unnamed protein product [Rotaria sordida]